MNGIRKRNQGKHFRRLNRGRECPLASVTGLSSKSIPRQQQVRWSRQVLIKVVGLSLDVPIHSLVFFPPQFYKFTGGHAWTSEYGNLLSPKIPEDIDFMYPLSPVHNVFKVLPARLLTVNAGDERGRTDAFLQIRCSTPAQRSSEPQPLLIYVDKSWLGPNQQTNISKRRVIDGDS